jgi:hypothetical protein
MGHLSGKWLSKNQAIGILIISSLLAKTDWRTGRKCNRLVHLERVRLGPVASHNAWWSTGTGWALNATPKQHPDKTFQKGDRINRSKYFAIDDDMMVEMQNDPFK